MILRTSLSLYVFAIAGVGLAQERRPPGAGDVVAEAVPVRAEGGEETLAREVQFVALDEPYTMEFFGYEDVPSHLAQKLIKERGEHQEKEKQ